MTDSAAKKAAPAPKSDPKPAPKPEDQAFESFIPELFLPALAKEIQAYGGPAIELRLEQAPMPVVGEMCWQVAGELPGGRRFWLCFLVTTFKPLKPLPLPKLALIPVCWSLS